MPLSHCVDRVSEGKVTLESGMLVRQVHCVHDHCLRALIAMSFTPNVNQQFLDVVSDLDSLSGLESRNFSSDVTEGRFEGVLWLLIVACNGCSPEIILDSCNTSVAAQNSVLLISTNSSKHALRLAHCSNVTSVLNLLILPNGTSTFSFHA